MFTCSHPALEESRRQAADVAIMQKRKYASFFVVLGLGSLKVSIKKNTSIESQVIFVMLMLELY